MKAIDTQATELEESAAYQLWLATNSWQRMLRRTLHPLGLTHVQYTVLASVLRLRAEGKIVTQTEVCRFGSLDPNMVSEVVGCLANRGLLERVEHPNDRRAKQLTITPQGQELYLRAKEVTRPAMELFFAPLGEEQRTLARMLGVIATTHRQTEPESD